MCPDPSVSFAEEGRWRKQTRRSDNGRISRTLAPRLGTALEILRGLEYLDHGSDSGGEVRSGDPCPGRKHPNMGRLVDWGGMEGARTPGRGGTKGERG